MQISLNNGTLQITTASAAETQELGRKLGAAANPGTVFLMSGQLGAGKTCLTQGIAGGLGVMGNPRSPTFVFVTQHKGRMPLFHVDLYRIKADTDPLDFGLEEYFDRDGVTVIEWAEKAPSLTPAEYLKVTIAIKGESSREITLEPHGKKYAELLRKVAAA